MEINDTRAQWSEEKRRRVATLEREHRKILEGVYGTLTRRNALKGKPAPEEAIQSQVQAISTVADLGALIDTLEGMGKIDRIDFMKRCVDRFAQMALAIEKPV